jgi:hypothetical protein
MNVKHRAQYMVVMLRRQRRAGTEGTAASETYFLTSYDPKSATEYVCNMLVRDPKTGKEAALKNLTPLLGHKEMTAKERSELVQVGFAVVVSA